MSKPTRTRLSRRTFLRGTAGACVALPWLESMAPAAGTAGAPPLRFVVVFACNGVIAERYQPLGTASNFSFLDPANPTVLRETAPLEPLKSDLVVLQNLSMKSRTLGPGANAHDKGMGHLLTANTLMPGPSGVGMFDHLSDGSVGGPSIDQAVAARIGGMTRLRSLELGVNSYLDTIRQLTSRMSYRGPFDVVPPENDPRSVYKNLFSMTTADPAQVAALLDQRRSVLDKVSADLNKLMPRVSARDRHKLDSHLTAVRELETSLATGGGGVCANPDMPAADLDPLKAANFPAVGKLQMDMMTLALSCDITRVASLQWSVAQSPVVHTWAGVTKGHHSLSHQINDLPASREDIVKVNNWYAQQFAYLLTKMKGQSEAGGSMLDNTLVLWCNEQSDGEKHSFDHAAFMLAGSAGKQLRTGRLVDTAGAAHNDLYVSVMNLMGATEVRTFGVPDVCKGPLAGLV